MTRGGSTRQRSVRWSEATLDALAERAHELGDSPNSLAERLVAEGLRTDRHPLIGFRADPVGRRRAALTGTRLYVSEIVRTVRASDNSLGAAAEYLGLSRAQIQAAAEYYADYREEVDADSADAERFAERERERWARAKQVFG